MPRETFESAIQEEDTSVQLFDTEPSPLMDTKQSREQKEFAAVATASLGDKTSHQWELEKELEPYKDDEALYHKRKVQMPLSRTIVKPCRKTIN